MDMPLKEAEERFANMGIETETNESVYSALSGFSDSTSLSSNDLSNILYFDRYDHLYQILCGESEKTPLGLLAAMIPEGSQSYTGRTAKNTGLPVMTKDMYI